MYRNGLKDIIGLEREVALNDADLIIVRNGEDYRRVLELFNLEKTHQGYSDSDLEGKVECNICFSVAGNERERFGLVVLESSANSDLGCDGEHAIGSYFVSSSYKYRLKRDVTVYAPFGFSLQKYVSGSKLDPSDFIFDDDN